MLPFDAPFWRAPPDYHTDAGVIAANPHPFIHTPNGSYTGDFHTPGRPFTTSLPTGHLVGRVVSLTADAHRLARGNLRTIGVDLLQPHPH
ncbi:hypothetical protein O181_105168 [Austropuccinia psidii MF-1]|uniref:Uncharacterized protein n=1 Tax=Austropuccinia psidii MF-1 TaxID=1389203 RepID=A0A9Q3JNI1_9BASI|nr:hypothetical protein [Austropuccinia psidii MF-1]